MNKQMKNLILLFATFFLLMGCSKDVDTMEPIKKTELLMGTVISVTLYDSNDTKILDEVFEKVRELESIFSINETGTEVDKINEMAGKEPVKVTDDTFRVVKEGLYYSNLSEGKFDVTIGPLVKLWSIGLPEAKVPTQNEIDEVLPLINFKDVILDEDKKTIFLANPNMMLDLGGIAKGYTADVISEILIKKDVNSAIIDLGGNIIAHGLKNNTDKWRIGVQNPFSDRGEIIGTLSVTNKSIVTSGTYERFIEQNGIRYHHILNPKTGYPYENEITGVTIISDKSSSGDALSTSIFAMGVKDGLDFIETLDGIDAIFVTKDNEIYITTGVKDIFEVTNSEFKIVN